MSKAFNQEGKPIKKQLAYSLIKDRIYWIDGRGDRTDVTDQFYHVLEAWAKEGSSEKQNCDRLLRWSEGSINVQVRYRDNSKS